MRDDRPDVCGWKSLKVSLSSLEGTESQIGNVPACCKKVQSMPEAYIGFGVRTYVDSSKLTRDIARGLLDLSMI